MDQLGQILVQKGYITQQQLDGAVAAQGEQQLGQVLIGWGGAAGVAAGCTTCG